MYYISVIFMYNLIPKDIFYENQTNIEHIYITWF